MSLHPVFVKTSMYPLTTDFYNPFNSIGHSSANLGVQGFCKKSLFLSNPRKKILTKQYTISFKILKLLLHILKKNFHKYCKNVYDVEVSEKNEITLCKRLITFSDCLIIFVEGILLSCHVLYHCAHKDVPLVV